MPFPLPLVVKQIEKILGVITIEFNYELIDS